MSKITKEDVAYIASLAQLDLDEAAQERLLHEMDEVLNYMDKLNVLNTDNVEPMMHAMDMSNVFRDDVVGKSLPRETALKNAPQHDDEYFIVPKILENDNA